MSPARRSQADPGPKDGPEAASQADEESGVGSFEASLDALEGIVDRLESGDLPLEEALAAFEAGVSLTRRCAEQLDSAERRIEVLVREGAGFAERPFDDAEDPE